MKLLNISPAFPPVLRRYALIMAAMVVASWVYTIAMTRLLHLPHPFGWVWQGGSNQWCDFKFFHDRSLHFRTDLYWLPTYYPMTYPAVVAVIFALLYKLPHPLKLYLAFLILVFLSYAVWLARGLAKRGIPRDQALGFGLVVVFTSWPILYQWDTANIEALVGTILFLGVLAVLSGRSWTGASLLALAGAMKIFPAVMFALLISKRRYKECAFGIALMAVINYASLVILGPSIGFAQAQIKDGFRFLEERYIIVHKGWQLAFSHALYMPVKYIVIAADRALYFGGQHAPDPHEMAVARTTLSIYLVVMVVLGTFLYFWRIRKLPMLNQVIALAVCGVTFTPFSSDYVLNHTLLPLGLLCFYATEAWREKRFVPGLETSFACLCIILGFTTFFTTYYPLGNLFRCAGLCFLLITVMRFPFYWSPLDSIDQTGQDFAPAKEG